MSGATPLIVVAGLGAHAARRTLGRWFAQRPGDERWALLGDEACRPIAGETPPAGFFPLPAACPCCSGALALRSAFARALRAAPWQRVFLLLPPGAHPAATIDALRAGLGAAALRVDAVIAVADARQAAPWLDAQAPGGEAAAALLEIASLAIVDGAGADRGGRLAARLAESPVGERRVMRAAAGEPGWGLVLDALHAPRPPGVRRWAPETVFERRRLLEALDELRVLAGPGARDPGLAMRGVFRTAREWYRWAPDAPRPWQPTQWRLDSQLQCALTDAEIASWLRSSLAQAVEEARAAADRD